MNETRDERSRGAEAPIPVINEELQIHTRIVDSANIRLIKKVEAETVDVPLTIRKHGYSIEHKPLNQYVDEAPPSVRYEGQTMVISIVEEEVVVHKRLKLVEEIRLTPSQEETVETKKVTLKKERITIEKRPGDKEEKTKL